MFLGSHKPHLKQGACVDNENWPFCNVVKKYNGLHHCIPLVLMVKKYIWNIQFGDWTKGLRSQEGVTILEVPTPNRSSDFRMVHF
jgi:hypothetical protein